MGFLFMLLKLLYDSRTATQKLPNSYTKSKMDTIWIPKIKNGYQIATLLGSHLGAKREPNGSQNQNALLPFLNIINRVLAFF